MNQTAAREDARTATLRYGLIGCGDIGVVRAAGLARTNSKLVAVSDIDPKRATAIAGRNHAVFDRDWHTLLARPDLDAVIISTPPSLHAEMCIEAVQMGKHVLCEKPLARTPDECRTIIDAAKRHNRVLAVGFNYRFYPSFARAKQLLDEGRIGELSHIRAYAGYSATGHNRPWVKDASVVGGGALYDNGIHLIDLVRWFLGEVEDVQGFSTGRVWQFGRAEDNGFLLLRSARGQVATLHASWTEWGRYEFRIELVGSLGKIVATCFPMRTEVMWSERVGGRVHTRRHAFLATMVGEHARSYRWVVARSFAREFDAFAAAVAGSSPALATGLDGLRAIEIACAATPLNGTSPGAAGA
jgi:predicted dehydrogenase